MANMVISTVRILNAGMIFRYRLYGAKSFKLSRGISSQRQEQQLYV
jgi:hypothetical protein